MQRVRASAAGLRVSLLLGIILSLLAIASGLTWAQNENETVGFASNHAFDSGQFGENIDILNGGLSLTIPIGQKYQVNQNLAYQLTLSYASRIWNMKQLPNDSRGLMRRGPMGLGNILHFGRIYRDAVQSEQPTRTHRA